MKQVKVLKVPVRYKGVTHAPGTSFEMEDEHVNESLVKVTGEVSEISKTKTSANTKGKTESG